MFCFVSEFHLGERCPLQYSTPGTLRNQDKIGIKVWWTYFGGWNWGIYDKWVNQWPGPYSRVSYVLLKKQDYKIIHNWGQLELLFHLLVWLQHIHYLSKAESPSGISSVNTTPHAWETYIGRCYSKVFSSLWIQLFARNSSLRGLCFTIYFREIMHWWSIGQIQSVELLRLHVYSALNHFEIIHIFKIRWICGCQALGEKLVTVIVYSHFYMKIIKVI